MAEHISVLLNESIEGLNIKEDGIYVDATLGRAGHSSHILSQLSNKGNINAYDVEVYDELPITFELDQYNPVTLNNNLVNYHLDGNILKILIPTIEPNNVLNIKVTGRIIN